MPSPKEETEIFVEFPEVHSYAYDKTNNSIYITFYDTIMEKEYTMWLDAFKFIEWFGTKQVKEIKHNTIKMVEKL